MGKLDAGTTTAVVTGMGGIPPKKEAGMVKLIQNIPLFFVILVLYNIVAALYVPESPGELVMEKELWRFLLPSQGYWQVDLRDLFLLFGLLILYVELIKSTSTGAVTIVDHTLSILVFIIYLVEFLLVDFVAESTFVILGFMSLLDVIAGLTISITAARRDISVT